MISTHINAGFKEQFDIFKWSANIDGNRAVLSKPVLRQPQRES